MYPSIFTERKAKNVISTLLTKSFTDVHGFDSWRPATHRSAALPSNSTVLSHCDGPSVGRTDAPAVAETSARVM